MHPRLRLPVVDPEFEDAVVEHLLFMLDALPQVSVQTAIRHIDEFPETAGMPNHAESFALLVPLLETCLDRRSEEMKPPLIAQFLFMAVLPAIPEAIAVQIAFGPKVAREHTREIARLISRASRRGLTVDEYVAQLAAADAIPRGTFVRLFKGEASRVPDADRVARGISLLRWIAATAPPAMRPPVLCTIAWLHWAQGKRAHAAAYLNEALRIDPDHILANGLSWLAATRTPVWRST